MVLYFMKYGHVVVSMINFSSERKNMHVCVVEQAYLYLTTESVFMLLFYIYFFICKIYNKLLKL